MRFIHLFCLFIVFGWLFFLANFAAPFISHPHTLPYHQTLYVDRQLNDFYFNKISNAALTWYITTNGQVKLDVVRLPAEIEHPKSSLIIVDLSPDFPEIIELDNVGAGEHLGYYYGQGYLHYIGLVSSRIDKDDLKTVILHELGHALGCEHLYGAEGIGTLMYPNIDQGANYITPTDLNNFCKIYHCDASKFQEIK